MSPDMPRSYMGFFESPNGLIPSPGACHPALVEHQATLVNTTEDEFSLDVLSYPYGNEWPALKRLHFHRSWAYGWDMFGSNWVWPVWSDQFGRAVGGEAALWSAVST